MCLWRNNGNRTFTEWTEPTGLGGSGKTAAAILTDFNNDRAVDLAVTGDGPSPLIYVNPREGKYPTQPLYEDAKLPPTVGIAVLDYNKDGWMDIAVTHAGAPGLTLWRNVEGPNHVGRRFERVELPLHGALRGWGLTPIDIDNDGWIDLAAIVETRAGPRVRVFRNRGDGSFEDVSHALGLDSLQLRAPRGLIAADVDGDGAADLIVTQANAPPVLLRNVGANKNHFVRLDLTGLVDNKTALGVKVEVFANGLWQKWELAGASGYQTQAAPQILVGLGDAEGIDLLRILWPTGVLQDEIDLPRQRVIAMKEADRRGSSCPVLFAWDGHQYKFVTDVIGAAVVGHWFTPTRRNIPNPGEWIKIDGAKVAPVNGKVSLRFMEPMEEVNYIDQLRLIAVDHPELVEVNPDERFLDDPPFASGRVVATAGARLPLGAWDGEGRDVLDQLSRCDHQFAGGFTPLPYDGFANLHALTLDLGAINEKAPLRLLMTGYVNYFSATSLYAAWQAGVKPISPYVEAELPDGSWQRIPGEAGFPAGLERTIVVDLTGKLPAGARRIRLVTNLEIYWDQVLIDQSADAEARTAELPLATATLHFRGYPKQIEGASPGDLDYDYDRVSLTGPFQHQRGNYTRMGDVTELVKSIDDRFVIFGSGEEIAAEFDAAKLPALPAHWKRDYFFYANGFVKDMDWWDASPFTVAQLPFHAMSTYPYPRARSIPDDARRAGLPVELERPLRLGRAGAVVSVRLPAAAFDAARGSGARRDTGDAAMSDLERCAGPGGAATGAAALGPDLRGGAGRGAHPADRAAESAAECLRRLRCGARARAGAAARRERGTPRRPLARSAGHGKVFDCDRGDTVRDRQPAARGRRSARRCGGGGAAARCGSADSGHDQLPGVPDGLRDRESAARAHAESVGSGAVAGRIERRRVGGHRGGAFGGGAGQRQRRIGARARALHGDLLAQAHAGAHSRPRASAAVRGSVRDSGRHRSHGAHHGRRCAALPRAERPGRARSGQSAGCAARARPG